MQQTTYIIKEEGKCKQKAVNMRAEWELLIKKKENLRSLFGNLDPQLCV